MQRRRCRCQARTVQGVQCFVQCFAWQVIQEEGGVLPGNPEPDSPGQSQHAPHPPLVQTKELAVAAEACAAGGATAKAATVISLRLVPAAPAWAGPCPCWSPC